MNRAVTQQHENMLICTDLETKSARTHAVNLFLSRYRFILLQLSLRAVEFARYADICLFTLTLCDHVLDLLDAENLDCFSYVHRSVVLYKDFEELTYDEAVNIIGKGTVISPFSRILLNSKINDHCLIETYCLLSHYSELKRNVILHSGVMIAGKTTIGENSVFNFKAAALNGLTICNNVEVGGASTITKNLDQPGRYIGSVARYVGERLPFNE
jgi:acetyltransferase-like isoleucine patch superfamily enzyme